MPVPPVVIVIQARMESARFPGKVLAPLCGQPMLLWQLHAVSQLQRPHRLIVASPNTPANHMIADCCVTHGYECLLIDGDPNDVLGRYRMVSEQVNASLVVRLTGDCPLMTTDMLEGLLTAYDAAGTALVLSRDSLMSSLGDALAPRHVHRGLDHLGIDIFWGDGLDCEVFTREALAMAAKEATLPSEREHVWPYLVHHPERFWCATYPCPFDLSWLRLSVDTEDDAVKAAMLLDACLTTYGMHYGWRDVWQTVARVPGMRAWMEAKAHNPAYLAQVAAETGQAESWATLRYSERSG